MAISRRKDYLMKEQENKRSKEKGERRKAGGD
jgi:hypothetical protein